MNIADLWEMFFSSGTMRNASKSFQMLLVLVVLLPSRRRRKIVGTFIAGLPLWRRTALVPATHLTVMGLFDSLGA
jgi:hypothetical protein